MTLQGALWLAKRVSLNFNVSFLNRISLLLIQVATQLSSRDWVDPVPDPILPEKFLGYSRKSNPGPLGWQSDVLTTMPNRIETVNIFKYLKSCNSDYFNMTKLTSCSTTDVEPMVHPYPGFFSISIVIL